MKVFFDTNIIIDTALRVDQYPESLALLSCLMDAPDFSLWASAISINNANYIISKLGDKAKANETLVLIHESFSIIPFRKSGFENALKLGAPDFEDAIQMASAEELGMDFIVTRNKDHFKGSKISILTPTEFLEKWNAGEFETVNHVPFLDLKAQHHAIYNEVDDRITDIIGNTGFILGKHVQEFEERFAAAQGAKYCIGVSSGTDALHVAIMALGIGPGDRVIVPVNTFMATAEAVSLCGAEPVFVDCDGFYNMDVKALRESLSAISDQPSALPKAVVPVHLYGQPANMGEIMEVAAEYGLTVVEDCAQAHLAGWLMADGSWGKVGNAGAFGCFSFYPGKNLGAYGEAGAVVTNDQGLYERARMIRQHGEIVRYAHRLVGHNYRMAAIQGAVLATKLKYLEGWTERRRENAYLYNELLKDVDGVQAPLEMNGVYAVYHLYVIRVDDRDGLQKYLGEKGVATGLHYPVPLHLQEAYEGLGHKRGDFPVAEKAAGRILSLPMYPELREEQIRYVVECVKGFFSG